MIRPPKRAAGAFSAANDPQTIANFYGRESAYCNSARTVPRNGHVPKVRPRSKSRAPRHGSISSTVRGREPFAPARRSGTRFSRRPICLQDLSRKLGDRRRCENCAREMINPRWRDEFLGFSAWELAPRCLIQLRFHAALCHGNCRTSTHRERISSGQLS